MTRRIKLTGKEIQIGDQIMTDEGFITIGGTIKANFESEIGLLTASGMITVNADDEVQVRREE